MTDLPTQSVAPGLMHGIARAKNEVTLAAPFDGVLSQVCVNEGDWVSAGDVLAVMDDRVARSAVRVAEANAEMAATIEHARQDLVLADDLLSRMTAADDGFAIAEFELNQARVRRDQARAALDGARQEEQRAKERLGLERARLDTHQVRAPFAGRVTSVPASPGQTLTSQHELLRIVDPRKLRIELYLPVEWFDTLHEGEAFRLRGHAPVSDTFTGRLTFAEREVDAASGTFRCVFEVDNSDGKLPVGFAVELLVENNVPVAVPYAGDSATRESSQAAAEAHRPTKLNDG
ncbi:MAG: efflux RND transporter periplasmic adaptor subunit [Pirellulales bacterium]